MTAGTRTRPARVLFAGGGTGGHLYPALALADAIRRRDPRTEVLFVGAQRGIESRVLPGRGEAHLLLPFEPLRRERVWENWRLARALVGSLAGVSRLFRTFQPDLVVGTGGYASGPAVGWGILKGVPTAVQEQNSYPGMTTRWVASRARQIHLAFAEARRYLKPGPRTDVFDYGNPIQPPDPTISKEAARESFGLGSGVVALVVGGSQGSRAINEALAADLGEVSQGRLSPPPNDFELLWATGPAHHAWVAEKIAAAGLEDRIHAVPYIERMPYALAAADLAVSRAGAMALAELCAWGVPAILVPLPTAAANHQYHNAQALEKAGAAVLVPEGELRGGRLWSELMVLAQSPERREALEKYARDRGRPDAADNIAAALCRLLGRN